MAWLYLVLGIAAGILAGIVGIGGGIIIVPALVFLFGMTQPRAQGTSLAALLAPVGIFAAMEYYKAGNMDLKAGILIALGIAIGGYFGGAWAQHLPQPVLRKVFGILLLVVGVRFLVK